MASVHDWATIVASALDWEQAHASFDNSLRALPADIRGKRPDGLPYSVWELLEHMRFTNRDLLDFVSNPNYHESKWPDDYWPKANPKVTDALWKKTLDEYHEDVKAMRKFTTDNADKLTEKIPWGSGQTYLRTVLVAIDHSAHHLGQVIAVRRLLGAWPPPK